MIGKMCSSLCEQHGGLGVLNNRYQHCCWLDRSHRCNGGEDGGISIMRIRPWKDVRISESYRNIERKSFLRARKKF
jgi:hypothetical protein